MRVVFLHIGTAPGTLMMPFLMVRSVRRHMPDVEIVQMTNKASPNVPDVDTRIEAEAPEGMLFPEYRMNHLAHIAEMYGSEPWVSLDTDIIVQEDLRPVFDQPFDVALTRRYGPIIMSGVDIVPEQPYNGGVMFSKCADFWRDARDWCPKLNEQHSKWIGEQICIAEVAKTGKYNVLELPCDRWNYSPELPDEDVSAKAIVHYKGARKNWMIHRECRA